MKRIYQITLLICMAGMLAGCARMRMNNDTMTDIKVELLEDYIEENQSVVSSGQSVYLAFVDSAGAWIDPPKELIERINASLKMECLPVSKAETKNEIVVDGHVFMVSIKWNSSRKVYEFEVGRHTAPTTGHGDVGEIKRATFKWVIKKTGKWTS